MSTSEHRPVKSPSPFWNAVGTGLMMLLGLATCAFILIDSDAQQHRAAEREAAVSQPVTVTVRKLWQVQEGTTKIPSTGYRMSNETGVAEITEDEYGRWSTGSVLCRTVTAEGPVAVTRFSDGPCPLKPTSSPEVP